MWNLELHYKLKTSMKRGLLRRRDRVREYLVVLLETKIEHEIFHKRN